LSLAVAVDMVWAGVVDGSKEGKRDEVGGRTSATSEVARPRGDPMWHLISQEGRELQEETPSQADSAYSSLLPRYACTLRP
jgi:hypothetical protein